MCSTNIVTKVSHITDMVVCFMAQYNVWKTIYPNTQLRERERETDSNPDKPTDRSMKENKDIDITGMLTGEGTTQKTVTGHPVLVKNDDT